MAMGGSEISRVVLFEIRRSMHREEYVRTNAKYGEVCCLEG